MTYEEKMKYYKLVGKNILHVENNIVYKVLMLTNMDSENENYPPSFVYEGLNSKKWSRALSTFNQSFKVVNETGKIVLTLLAKYRDGGTAIFTDSLGNKYYRDGRLSSPTIGQWFTEYPGERFCESINIDDNYIILEK